MMLLKSVLFSSFVVLCVFQAGCAGQDPIARSKMGYGQAGHNVRSFSGYDKCAELKAGVKRASSQVRFVERSVSEKLGTKFNKTERSLIRHPEELRNYTSSLDHLAMAVQTYKSQCS